MEEAKHKGTPDSNVNKTEEQDGKDKAAGAETNDTGNEFTNVSEVGQQNEQHKEDEAGQDKETLGDNYWDSVADDVAAGYKTEDDENSILNEDQLPDDNERGDTTSE